MNAGTSLFHGRAQRCSFCGKERPQATRLITGPGGVFICDECVRLCMEIIKEKAPPVSAGSTQGSSWTVSMHGPARTRHLFAHAGQTLGARALKIVSTAEMRALEQGSVELDVSLDSLMDNAGLAVAREVQQLLGGRAGRAQVLVGPGNNGGDGLVCAGHLREWGWQVFLHFAPVKERDRERFPVLKDLAPGPITDEPVDVVIDALLGTGSSRPIEGPLAEAVEAVRRKHGQAPVVAVDLPSGVNADTGAADPKTLRARLTVTLGLAKAGLFQYPALACSGEIRVVDIGIPAQLTESVKSWLSGADLVRPFLPARPQDAHKGTFGKLLVVAGCASYTGAPYLTSMAALRVGAGLVRLAVPKTIHPIVASKITETTFAILPDDDRGCISRSALPVLESLLQEDFDCLLIGPGLGQDDETRDVVQQLLLGGTRLPRRVVIDADGLNNIARDPEWHGKLARGCVLTPHPAEFARLANISLEEVLANRFELTRQKAREWGQTIVAKGANCIIAGPDGRTVIDPGANPLVATAGTGDVLAGSIAGMLTQGAAAWEGACTGARISSMAAGLLVARFGRAGMVASDLHEKLPEALAALSE